MVVDPNVFRSFALACSERLLNQKISRILRLENPNRVATFVAVHLASVPERQYDSARVRHALRNSSREKRESGETSVGIGII